MKVIFLIFAPGAKIKKITFFIFKIFKFKMKQHHY